MPTNRDYDGRWKSAINTLKHQWLPEEMIIKFRSFMKSHLDPIFDAMLAVNAQLKLDVERLENNCQVYSKTIREQRGYQHKDLTRISELGGALKEVMSWIDNWDPNFADDPEWDDTLVKVNQALGEAQKGESDG